MLYEFALLPEVIEEAVTNPDTSHQRELIELLKRVRENAMLVDTDYGAWSNRVKHVIERVSTEGGSYHAEITTLLRDLMKHHRIVRHRLTENQVADDWLQQAEIIRGICRFDGILAPPSLCLYLSELPDYYHPFPHPPGQIGRTNWHGRRSRSTRKCRAEFESALDAVLRHAQRADLVDPYINCEERRYQQTLELCVELLSKNHAEKPQLVIHTSPMRSNHTTKNWKASWSDYFQRVPASRPLTLRAYCWKGTPTERFHNRYVFTDQGVGLSIPHGLDCHEPNSASSDIWQMMDVEEAQREWTKFTSAPVYDLDAKVRVER